MVVGGESGGWRRVYIDFFLVGEAGCGPEPARGVEPIAPGRLVRGHPCTQSYHPDRRGGVGGGPAEKWIKPLQFALTFRCTGVTVSSKLDEGRWR